MTTCCTPEVGGLRDEQRLEAWVYQLTRNAIIDHGRALARAGNPHARLGTERTGPVSRIRRRMPPGPADSRR